MPDQAPNPHWFTAAEIASIVRHCSIPCFPISESGVVRWIKRQASEFPDGFGEASARLSRKRPGKGGPTEFHLHLFDVHGLGQLLIALEAAALQRKEGLCIRAVPPDDLLSLSDEDKTLMRSMLPSEAWVRLSSFEPLRPRSVKRCMIEFRTERYWSCAFRAFEGRKVLITSLPGNPAIVFAWRSDGSGKRLACHGKAGLIDMIPEPVPKPGLGSYLYDAYREKLPDIVNFSEFCSDISISTLGVEVESGVCENPA